MKSIIGYALASAAVVTAQVSYNETTGEFLCAKANAAYCAGDSLGTDIIIRCTGTKGQPGRCTNNLAGYPPLGVQPALCWQSSDTAGDAACEKNCVVYAPSSSWTLPSSVCTPYYTATGTSTSTSTTAQPTTTSTIIHTKPTSSHSATAKTDTTTVTTCEETSSTTTKGKPTYSPSHNITTTPSSTTKPTGQPPITAGAAANKAAGALVVVGLVAAYVF